MLGLLHAYVHTLKQLLLSHTFYLAQTFSCPTALASAARVKLVLPSYENPFPSRLIRNWYGVNRSQMLRYVLQVGPSPV